VKIKFTQSYQVKAVDGAFYAEGSVHDFRDDAARHYLVRGVAVAVAVAEKPKAPSAAPVPVVETTSEPEPEEVRPRRGRPRKPTWLTDERDVD